MSKTKMRTARNIFIVTLSSSDLVLCLVAMPLTLWDVLRSETMKLRRKTAVVKLY